MTRPVHPDGRSAPSDRRAGQMVVVFAVVLAALLPALLALTADVGRLTVARASLQNAADASALAAVKVLLNGQSSGVEEGAARASATAEAGSLQQANANGSHIAVEFGQIDGVNTFAPAGTAVRATAVRVSVFRDQEAPDGPVTTVFAGLFGLKEVAVSAEATAFADGRVRSIPAPLSPFAVPEDRIPLPEEEFVFYPCDAGDYDDVADTSTAAGCFGLLNLDGGDLGQPEIEEWILNGYHGPLAIDPEEPYLWVEGTSGFRAALETEMDQRLGSTVLMLIYDQTTGQGATTEFRITGFLLATVTDCALRGNDPHITCQVHSIVSLHNLAMGGATWSPNIRKIHLIG